VKTLFIFSQDKSAKYKGRKQFPIQGISDYTIRNLINASILFCTFNFR
jgi:hypothetical protein